MKTNRASRLRITALVGCAGLLAACSLNPKEDPTRYYVLASLADDPGLYPAAGLVGNTLEEASLSAGPHLSVSVGIGPVMVPTYLKRSRMATRVSATEMEFLETERWAQPLEEAIAHVVTANVSALLWAREVRLHPWYSTQAPDYSVRIDIGQFERDSTGAILLAVQWSLLDSSGEVLYADDMFTREAAAGTTVAASVTAQSALLAQLSRQITDAIRRAAS